MITFLQHVMGLDDASGNWYLWWSGIGADLGMLGGAVALIRKHQCHVTKCWRLGKHQLPDTPWVVCTTHHPEEPPTAKDYR